MSAALRNTGWVALAAIAGCYVSPLILFTEAPPAEAKPHPDAIVWALAAD